MSKISFRNAFYIKLGHAGKWEDDSIATGKLRFGWPNQTLQDINTNRWDIIKNQLREELKSQSEATRALNGLKRIVTSDSQDIWITFHKSKLWWTKIDSSPITNDQISKFRKTAQPWSDLSIKKKSLTINDLPGKLAKIQGFRWTICKVDCSNILHRVLNGTQSDLAIAISSARTALTEQLIEAIKELHWKDFETLVDLVFRNAGWIRVSVLGQHAKAYDLELREPITNDRYIVQVKSKASLVDLKSTIDSFSSNDFRFIYFVVHSPTRNLLEAKNIPSHVKVISPNILALHAIDSGLTEWLKNKVF